MHLIITFLFLAFTAQSQASCITPECKGFKKDLEYFVQKGIENYCYWEDKIDQTGHDFRTIAAELMDQIDDSTTNNDFYRIMRTWAASFHDGHVDFLVRSVGSPIMVASAKVRFELLNPTLASETLIVAQAEPRLNLKMGDVVTRIGNLTPSEAIQKALITQSGSTERMRRFGAAKRIVEVLAPEVGTKDHFSLEVKRPGSPGSIHVAVPYEMVEFSRSLPISTLSYPVDYQILEDNIGYLKIRRFIDSEFGIIQAMDQLAGTDALIIDLRGNTGGDESANEVLNRLITSEINRYSESARASMSLLKNRRHWAKVPMIPGSDFTQWMPNLVSPSDRAQYLNKKVIALIGPDCFSACDTFVAALRSHGLATLIGMGTGGGTGTPLVQTLPYSRHDFRYSVIRGRTSDGKPIEGVGTEPDHVLEISPHERAMGLDTALARAVQEITGNPTGIGFKRGPGLVYDCNFIFQ